MSILPSVLKSKIRFAGGTDSPKLRATNPTSRMSTIPSGTPFTPVTSPVGGSFENELFRSVAGMTSRFPVRRNVQAPYGCEKLMKL